MVNARRPSGARQVELVDAALEIIATQGLQALTTRSLAEAVGLTTGAIFRHFTSLDALRAAVVTRVEEVLEATYPSPSLPPAERLARFVEARSAAVGAHRGVLRLLLSEQFHLALPPGDAARLARAVTRTRKFLVETVREGQGAGAFRADVAPEALAPIIMGTTQVLAWASHAGRRAGEGSATVAGLLALLAPPKRRPRRSTP
jgi:AcrR family transcriptional regulator